MQELKYQLVKEDYFDWIHWNVARNSMKKTKIITAVIYAAFVLFFVGNSIVQNREPAAIFSSIVMVLILGGFMFYIISPRHQVNTIWKRSGLKRLEKTGGFPKINLTVREDGVTMEVPDQVCKDYSYTEVTGFEETPRLYLLGTSDRAWQFVAKSAFESPEKGEEFMEFIKAKIADAEENPEKYPKREKEDDKNHASLEQRDDGEEESSQALNEEETPIRHVDTSGMGKIGKMANIIAAMSEGDEEAADEELEKH